MPMYEYECQSCHKRFEKLQKYSDKPCTKCPTCGGALRKLISSPAIQFKGGGFYITDYAKKNSPSETEKRKADTSGGSSSGTKSESKSESKSETKSESSTSTPSSTESKPAAKPESK